MVEQLIIRGNPIMLPQQAQRKTVIISFFILVQVALSISGGMVLAYSPERDTIYQGILVNQVDVGGLTKEAAFARLNSTIRPLLEAANLKVRLDRKEWLIPFSSIRARYDLVGAVEEAYQVGRQENILLRAFSNFELSLRKKNIKLNPVYERKLLQAQLTKIATEVYRSAIDARISLVGDQFVIKPEQNGLAMDIEENLNLLAKKVTNLDEPVSLVSEVIRPRLTTADLIDIKDSIAVYATSFNLHNTNRVHNIRLAAKEINGVVVKPGEVFSFNEKVGPRMRKYGYKEAPVISNNKLVPGIGGGACQVSTTLYHTVLHSGLEVKERFPHSKPPVYVPLGQDAAVADNLLDFKFLNTRKTSILILAEVRGDQLIVRLFGKKEQQEPEISLISEEVKVVEPQVIIKKDPSLPRGVNIVVDAGEKGYKVKVFRVISQNGKPVKKELLSHDYYKPAPTVIRVGISPGKAGTVK